MTDDWYSIDGLPSDLLTSEKAGDRRVKVEVGGDIIVENLIADFPHVGDINAAAPAKAGLAGGIDENGSLQALAVDLAGALKLWRGESQAQQLFVGWQGSQQVTVSGTVHIATQGNDKVATEGDWLTDAQLRAAPVPVDTGLTTQTDALTDAQLRAAPVPVDTGLTTQTDALTDTELRASPVGVDTGLTQPTTPSDTQPVSAAALPLPTGAATAANQLPDNHNVTVSNFPAIQIVDGTVTSDKGAGWVDPQTDALTDAELRASPIAVENLTQLVPEQYDDIELGYTGLDLTTVTYRSGGAVVATLTLTYTLGQLTRVVRS